MKKKSVHYLVQAALIAAIYAALTYAVAPLSFGATQFRISEALTVLPVFTPAAIPGLAIPAVITSCFGAIWVMYGKLCKELGISLKDNTLKILARAAITNIAMNLTGVILGALAGMLIPGASIPVSAIVTFATVYLAGMMFLQLILKMAQKSTDPHTFSDISADEMKKTVSGIKLSKDDLEAAKKVYENNKG